MDNYNDIVNRIKCRKVNVSNSNIVTNDSVCNKKSKYIITKILLSIVFLMSSLIFIKLDDNNKLLYKKEVLTNSLSFTSINNWYEKYFGSVAPVVKNEKLVFSDDMIVSEIKDYDTYELLSLKSSNAVSSITGGIVVYIGNKDNLGETIIVQGNDGFDIWYGNMENINVKLYDYIEGGSIIGSAINNKLKLSIRDNDKYIKYEEYKN